MGLSNFWELFSGDTVFSTARLTYALASNLTDSTSIRKSIAKQVEKTDAVFVDIAFVLMNMTGDDFVTSHAICNDIVVPADANMYVKSARFPLTMSKLAEYIAAYICRLVSTRRIATAFVIGTDSHVHVPVTKHNTWNKRDYNGREQSASSKAPFSRNEETLTTSLLYIAQNNPAEFRNAVLGATFTTTDNMLHDMLKDRYIRPLLLSVLFDLVRPILDDTLPRKDILIHFLHPIFNMTENPITLGPNLYTNNQWIVSSEACDIGEADLQFAWFLNKTHAPPDFNTELQFEVHCDDSDVVMIVQSFYLHLCQKLKPNSNKEYTNMPAIYMFRGRCQVIDLRHVFFESIPLLYANVTGDTVQLSFANMCNWYRFFLAFCLIFYQTDYEPCKIHGLGSTYKNMVSILNVMASIMKVTKDELEKNKDAVFTMIDHRLIDYEYNSDNIFPVGVTFDSVQMIKLVQMTIKIHHKKRAETSTSLSKDNLIKDIHIHIHVRSDIFNVTKQYYSNMSLRELHNHWNAYILLSGKVCPRETPDSTVKHPVLMIRQFADTDATNTFIEFADIKIKNSSTYLMPIYDFATTEQLRSFLLYILAACEYGQDIPLNRKVYECDHPCAHDNAAIYFSRFDQYTIRTITSTGIKIQSTTTMGNVQNLSQTNAIITNPSITGADAWENYKSDKRMDALGRSVFFPGDLTFAAVFSRVAIVQWTLCYWAAGFRPQSSKQSTFFTTHVQSITFAKVNTSNKGVFSNNTTKYPQFAELLLLGGYELHIKKYDDADEATYISNVTRHPPYEVVKFVKDAQTPNNSHKMIVKMNLMPVNGTASANISQMMISQSLLFTPLKPLVITIETVDPVYEQAYASINLLRMTELDHMAALSLVNRNWIDMYCDTIRETQHLSYDNASESVVYADEQLVFRYVYAKSIMEKDTSTFTNIVASTNSGSDNEDDERESADESQLPYATGTTCLLETIPHIPVTVQKTGDSTYVYVCVPTTTTQHMSPMTDVTLNSNNLGEYVLGFTFPAEISAQTYSGTAPIFTTDHELQAMLAANNVRLTEVLVCNRTDAIQTSDTFMSGIDICVRYELAENSSFNKSVLSRIVRNVVASLYYATIPLRITENARIQSRTALLMRQNTKHTRHSLEDSVTSLHKINIKTDAFINRRLSTSLHVCDYGLPLLKKMPYDSRPDYWPRFMMPWLCLFKEYMEQSFVSFIKWKIVLSVYHRFCARNVMFVDFVKPSKGFFVADFFRSSIGDAHYTTINVQQITNTARMYTHLTWPVAFIDLHNMPVSTPDEFGKKVFVILQQHQTVCNALCFCWPSAENTYASVTRIDSTPDIVAKITFVDWDEAVLQHYLFSGLLRMQNMMTYKTPFDSLVENPVVTVGEGDDVVTVKMVFEKTLTARQN